VPVQQSAAVVARQPETGVHVCAPNAYLSRYLVCTKNISQFAMRHLSAIHLSATGIDGANFTSANLTVNISEDRADGGYTLLGTFTVPVGLSYGVWSLPVEAAFSNAGIHAHAGHVYKIEVDEGSTLLGSTAFTVVHQCPRWTFVLGLFTGTGQRRPDA
jgi:type IV secretory pathway protease TraF